MEETHAGTWTSVTNSLETAVLLPQRRDEIITSALQQVLTSIPAVGTALIWPCPNRKVPWKVYYVGIKRDAMHRWLSSRLHPSLDTTTGVLQHDLLHHNLSDMPPHTLLRLYTSPASLRGLWILWTDPLSLPETAPKLVEPVHRTLEAMLEVEDKETHYFAANSPLYDREIVEALAHD